MISFIHKTHAASRSIKIKVETSGEVVVVTPRFISKKQIEQFVTANLAWIEKTQKKVLNNRPVNDTQVEIFGKQYHKKIINSSEFSPGVRVVGQQILINSLNANPDDREIHQKLDKFFKNTAEKYLVPRIHQIATKMLINFSKIVLRQQKTRWGSCSSTGTLSFNWRLVHYPPAVIDYVIVHELSHRKQMNHSDKFWALVAKYDPQYKIHRNWLKKRGMSLG